MSQITRAHLVLCDADRISELHEELRTVGLSDDGVDQPENLSGALLHPSDAIAEIICEQGVAFARQTLPYARLIAASAIKAIVRECTQAIIEGCDQAPAWQLHILTPIVPEDPGHEAGHRAKHEAVAGPGRLKLIGEGIAAELKKRRRRLLKSMLASHSFADADAMLVQIYPESRERIWISTADAETRQRWRRSLSPWPGGRWDGPEDRNAPSRAYRKLQEALATSGLAIRPGDLCVDLGASPGGWSYVALAHGAQVVAVDRSELAPELMSHKRLRFVSGDAFRFEPESRTARRLKDETRVDWLVCDVIAYPERSVELLERWLSNRWCRHFCVTIKFRGEADFEQLTRVKNMLSKYASDWIVRRLCENKNEVTTIGSAMS